MQRNIIAALAVVIGIGVPGAVRAEPASPLHDGLTPGPYGVGFRTSFVMDDSRSFFPSEELDGRYIGRPVRIMAWYPAGGRGASEPMRFAEYVEIASPADVLGRYNGAIVTHESGAFSRQVIGPGSEACTERLADLTVAAVRDAPPADGAFPLIVHSTGIGSWQGENIVLYEHLASHGYVVVSVPQVGPCLEEPGVSYTASYADLQRRDVETALTAAIGWPFVDASRIGATGHSFGGLVVLWLASRNQNIDAIACLDGSIVIPGGVELLGVLEWDRESVAIPILNQYTLASGERDRSILDSLGHADRYHVVYENASHYDFQNWPILIAASGGAGDTRATDKRSHEDGRQIYLSVVRITRQFFDAVLKGRSAGLAYARGERTPEGLPAGTTFDRDPATKAAEPAEGE